MSLEAKIDGLNSTIELLVAAVTKLTEALTETAEPAKQLTTQVVAAPVTPPIAPPVAAPVPAPVAPVGTAVPPVAPPVQSIAAGMPPAPTFAAPAPVEAVALPFSDHAGLIQYVMSAYRDMGPTKGAKIQQVMVGLGYSNINDVKPEHYAALHSGVEALKKE